MCEEGKTRLVRGQGDGQEDSRVNKVFVASVLDSDDSPRV
jgi:hypothetical protein